ncbi:MAG: hypothetical protein V1874_08300 [Spirochaetota bacterium]
MKTINDSKLYLYFIIITFCIGIILGLIFSYSAFIVEPEIKELILSEDNIDENLKKAYQKLKDPQIFARYENFDFHAVSIKSIINVYDKKLETNEEFSKNDRIYLQILLNRRELGSLLTRNTMIFFFLLSLLGSAFYIYELKKSKE